MPTLQQITAAKAALVPNPYTDDSTLTADNADILYNFLTKYLYDHKKTGAYTKIKDTILAQKGIKAAQLQAVLQNVSNAGSKVATLVGQVNYGTQETIDNELEYALFIMYKPVNYSNFGTKPSDMATVIRGKHKTGCDIDELQVTKKINGII